MKIKDSITSFESDLDSNISVLDLSKVKDIYNEEPMHLFGTTFLKKDENKCNDFPILCEYVKTKSVGIMKKLDIKKKIIYIFLKNIKLFLSLSILFIISFAGIVLSATYNYVVSFGNIILMNSYDILLLIFILYALTISMLYSLSNENIYSKINKKIEEKAIKILN